MSGYVGRLAPSPTGALHLGNVRTFMIAWLRARSLGGKVIMRMEDLDHPKDKPGAASQAIEDLKWLGFDWDEEYVQSERKPLYAEATRALHAAGLIYPCVCSRRDVEAAQSAPHAGEQLFYPGTCRGRFATWSEAAAVKSQPCWRFDLERFQSRTPAGALTVSFDDVFAGFHTQVVAATLGDFPLARDEGGAGYTLAAVYDDLAMGVTEVVRGDDLLTATPAQILVAEALKGHVPALAAAKLPRYCHVPLVVGTDGKRLAKRHGDTRIATYREQGLAPERLIGELAATCGWCPTGISLSLAQLLPDFRLSTIPHSPVSLSGFKFTTMAKFLRCAFSLALLLLPIVGSAASPMRKLSNHLWFAEDFDHPPELANAPIARFCTEPNSIPIAGRIGKARHFTRGCSFDDEVYVRDFPWREGSFSCWAKGEMEDVASNRSFKVFGVSCGKREIGLDSQCFYCGTFHRRLDQNPRTRRPIPRSTAWRHYAGTWQGTNWCLYVDGKLVNRAAFPELTTPLTNRLSLALGCAPGGGRSGETIDEFAIFDVALTPTEIEGLAMMTHGLREGQDRFLAGPIEFTQFFRDQTNAALRLPTRTPTDMPYAAELTVGGIRFGTCGTISKGDGWFAAPFDPSRLRAGDYDYTLKVCRQSGDVLFRRQGRLTVAPRFNRSAFPLMNWGGNRAVSPAFVKQLGLNTCNAMWNRPDQIRRLLSQGLRVNLRYENANAWVKNDCDFAAIGAETERNLQRYAGLAPWNMTLFNSEVYYGTGTIADLQASKAFCRAAKNALGHEPAWEFTRLPPELEYQKLGLEKFHGVITNEPAAFRTVRWLLAEGKPVYSVNAANAAALHRLQPDNLAWSEPLGSAAALKGVDMGADWFYDWDVNVIVFELWSRGSRAAQSGKYFMPTLSMYNNNMKALGGGAVPTGLDELKAHVWLALGAVPAHALSFFSADTWEYGKPEPGTAEQFGVFIRDELLPVAELLRDLPNERAPIAFLTTSEIAILGGWRFVYEHYTRTWMRAIARSAVPVDFLTDADCTAEKLARYRYVLWPMANVVTREHDAALRSAALRGTIIVGDLHSGVTNYPGFVRLDSQYKIHPKLLPETAAKPLLDWYTNGVMQSLQQTSFAASDGDGSETRTFVKEYRGAKYVFVLNDARRADQSGYLRTFATNDWYRPYGAPRRIATKLALSQEASVTEFGTGRNLGTEIVSDYGPSQARVYCVYPCSLNAPRLAYENGTLVVTIADRKGRPAAGRQLVALTVRDADGQLHDETGRYAVEGGRLIVPLRIADDEDRGGFFRRWKASARELTTGKEDSLSFTVNSKLESRK